MRATEFISAVPIGPRERNGFRRFLELARDAGELDLVPDLRFVDDPVPA
jgi:hypothetical protein